MSTAASRRCAWVVGTPWPWPWNGRQPASQPPTPNLSAARTFAFAASSSRFLGGAFVSSEWRKRVEIPATSSTAARNASSFAFDGLLKPLIFLTNCSEAARISSTVTGGSKLKRVLIFLHIQYDLNVSGLPGCANAAVHFRADS